jgi:hypothetical protein
VAEPILLEVREPRRRFGRAVKWAFFAFQIVTLGAGLATCSVLPRYMGSADPEVAMGAGLFGAQTLGTLMAIWPLGTILLGGLALATRGRKRVIAAPADWQRSA